MLPIDDVIEYWRDYNNCEKSPINNEISIKEITTCLLDIFALSRCNYLISTGSSLSDIAKILMKNSLKNTGIRNVTHKIIFEKTSDHLNISTKIISMLEARGIKQDGIFMKKESGFYTLLFKYDDIFRLNSFDEISEEQLKRAGFLPEKKKGILSW